jgi:hypothetical protein
MLKLEALSIKFLFLAFVLSSFVALADGKTIANSIKVPDGYIREEFPSTSYSNWIRNLPLKERHIILDHRGKRLGVYSFYNVFAVVEMPLLFDSDLEQCADYAMRFWAEYHKDNNKLDSLYLFDYNGNKRNFSSCGKTYVEFLKRAFSYSNSYSLKEGCKEVEIKNLKPGDMIVQNESGSIGHVSIILDVCASGQGEKLYLIGYSFMPAQEFHIEKADDTKGIGGWFKIEEYFKYLSEYLPLGEPVLRRF